MELKQDIIDNICQNILHYCKFKKLDAYSIFRYLTGKQGKRNNIFIDVGKLDMPNLSQDDEIALAGFITQVNPFFNVSDTTKLEYYRKNYHVAQKVYEKCKRYVEERSIVSYYQLKKINNTAVTFLTYYDLDDKPTGANKNDAAQYSSREEAVKQANKFLALYRFLKLDMALELIAFNCNHEILEKSLIN